MTVAGAETDPEALLRLRHLVARVRPAREATTAMPGPIVTRWRGRGSEPDDIRLWSHGDDIRHIDRNTTARTGVPHVRTFRSERDSTMLLMADFRPPMLFGTRRALRSVAAAEILALAGWRAVGLGAKVGLLAVGGPEPIFVQATAGERAMPAVIGALHRAHARALSETVPDRTALSDMLEMAAALAPRGGVILAATGLDQPGDRFETEARRIGRRCDLGIALVSDAFERKAPPGTYPYLTFDGARGVRLVRRDLPADDHGPRIAALRALGLRAVRFDAEQPPQAQLRALGELHGDAS
ncbi:DUF58 domain-containing protein [Labrys wisconsinensis]|uniref:Uncharacterized protein (DUF58 family) n=1 Tax=Labrys wisconsinensis TaxID=425677 RepID=A0ABU0JD89_9HYPH|nr:DUF58 domain-containing protein [Labrys wisconsinensis]MDQ0472255.1 uncharacterized protein (DUF58 family) [Labrys wisconsinensis]